MRSCAKKEPGSDATRLSPLFLIIMMHMARAVSAFCWVGIENAQIKKRQSNTQHGG